jgi:hypothetical protein
MPGLRDKRQTAQVITNRIKVAALIKSRSVDTPGFLSGLVVLTTFMRLSLLKTAYAVPSGDT